MKMGYCTVCGRWAVVHGNGDMVLCDDCCPCYNHSPYLGRPWAGKYYEFSMGATWHREAMKNLFCV